jgi:glycosyltransferase involved in cell wall biosynthesis
MLLQTMGKHTLESLDNFLSSREGAKISVCIAAYQGERFIALQLRSILAQLSEADEVIIVDDHSSDGTCDQVRALADPRIHLIQHEKNQGVARAFEEAISRASGNVIFLSDQDDLWASGKVARVIEAFDNPDVTLVTTDAALIDEDGVPLGVSYYAQRGKFQQGLLANLIRCKYLGCTMAFRSELVAKVIPFPQGSDVLHDIWIGVVNSITSGTTRYLDEPLVWYRRHSTAVTQGNLSVGKKIRARLHLIKAVMGYWARNLLVRRVGT